MPRTARASPGGLCYHVMNRGNGRMRVFGKDGDYEAFLRVIEEVHVTKRKGNIQISRLTADPRKRRPRARKSECPLFPFRQSLPAGYWSPLFLYQSEGWRVKVKGGCSSLDGDRVVC